MLTKQEAKRDLEGLKHAQLAKSEEEQEKVISDFYLNHACMQTMCLNPDGLCSDCKEFYLWLQTKE